MGPAAGTSNSRRGRGGRAFECAVCTGTRLPVGRCVNASLLVAEYEPGPSFLLAEACGPRLLVGEGYEQSKSEPTGLEALIAVSLQPIGGRRVRFDGAQSGTAHCRGTAPDTGQYYRLLRFGLCSIGVGEFGPWMETGVALGACEFSGAAATGLRLPAGLPGAGAVRVLVVPARGGSPGHLPDARHDGPDRARGQRHRL